MIVLVPALAGALIVGGVIALVVGLTPSEVVQRPPRKRHLKPLPRQTQWLLAAGAITGLIAVMVTGWAMALLLVPIAFVGLPALLSSGPAQTRIGRLEAMEEWTRSLVGRPHGRCRT